MADDIEGREQTGTIHATNQPILSRQACRGPPAHRPTGPPAHRPTGPTPTGPPAHRPTGPPAHRPTAPPPNDETTKVRSNQWASYKAIRLSLLYASWTMHFFYRILTLTTMRDGKGQKNGRPNQQLPIDHFRYTNRGVSRVPLGNEYFGTHSRTLIPRKCSEAGRGWRMVMNECGLQIIEGVQGTWRTTALIESKWSSGQQVGSSPYLVKCEMQIHERTFLITRGVFRWPLGHEPLWQKILFLP